MNARLPALLIALACGAWTSAQPPADPPPPRQPATPPPPLPDPAAAPPPGDAPRGLEYDIRLDITPGFSADFDDAPGSVTTTRFDAGFGIEIPAGERGELELTYDFGLSDYDFDGATGIIPGTDDPWSEVHQHEFEFRYTRQASPEWGWILGGGVGWAGEPDADLNDSVYGLGYFGLQYTFRPGLVVGFGGGVRSRIEDNPLVIPFALIHWQINEQWALSNEGRIGLTLTYAINDHWTLALAGEWDYLDFRLDDDPLLPSGVVRDNRYPVSLGVRWTPRPYLRFRAGAGFDVARDLVVEDENGNEVSDTDLEAAPFVGLSFRILF
jgi:Domain of unknown function (DUF6268)